MNKVVILIDEYDKPILDHLENIELAKTQRDVLRNFYTVIKGMDQHLKFVLLTGVTKFSKTSVFSGLNNLNDISMKSEAAELRYTADPTNSSGLPQRCAGVRAFTQASN